MIPLVKVAMPPREALMPALEAVLYSGMIAEGEAVARFEAAFASHFGLSDVAAISSGTGALHIALLLAGAAPGTEVITTPMTAEPTNTTILHTGATPVFADVDPETGNLDPDDVAARITSRTCAICVVHYAGYPADLSALKAIADRHGIALVEDCAHALGARWQGRPVGTVGNFGIHSFQAIKHMTSVDGGMLTLSDAALLPEARRLRWFGMARNVPRTEVDIRRPGFKYNMTNVAATIGLAQLDDIDARLDAHIANGRAYDAALAGLSGIRPGRVLADSSPSYWLYTALSDEAETVISCLADIGVMASKLHRPNHYHTVFKSFAGALPGLDQFYRQLVHIPCGWWVNEDDRARIIDALKKG